MILPNANDFAREASSGFPENFSIGDKLYKIELEAELYMWQAETFFFQDYEVHKYK